MAAKGKNWGLFLVFLSFFLFFNFPLPLYAAASWQINFPSALRVNETLPVTITLNDFFPRQTYFLKCAFYQDNGKRPNYFALTKVADDWVKNSANYQEQYSLTTDEEGNWKGELSCRVDEDDSGYHGPGLYYLQIARYTSGGTLKWLRASDSLHPARDEISLQPPLTPSATPVLSSSPSLPPPPSPFSSPSPVISSPSPSPSPSPSLSLFRLTPSPSFFLTPTIFISPSLTPLLRSSPTPLSPQIRIFLPSFFPLSQTVTINFELNHFPPQTSYFFKGLLAPLKENNHPYYFQTWNPENKTWRAWNASWESLPLIKVNSGGRGKGKVRGRMREGTPEGDYYFRLRLRGTEDNKIIDSPSQIVALHFPPSPSFPQADLDSFSTTVPLPPQVNNSNSPFPSCPVVSSSPRSSKIISAWVAPPEAAVREKIAIPFVLCGGQPNQIWHLKVRGGKNKKYLYDLQTWSPEKEKWLSWNQNWSYFPRLKLNQDGCGRIILSSRLAPQREGGKYFIQVRLQEEKTRRTINTPGQKTFFIASPRGSVAGVMTSLPQMGQSLELKRKFSFFSFFLW